MGEYFKEVLGAPVEKRKNLEILLAKHNLNPARCFFFGDAESDYLAAHICGVEFFGIVQGEDAPLLQAQPEARWTKNFIGFEEKFDLVP
jgi:phosphoglycolate phosphatase-like HAD superfamily hydrolase